MKKNCRVCGKEFETEYNFQIYCSKPCRKKNYHEKNKHWINPAKREKWKEYYKENREKERQRKAKHRKENRLALNRRTNELNRQKREDFLNKYKKGRCCEVCGWKEHPEILQFHHKDRTEKNFTLGNVKAYNLLKSKMEKEIKKCVLLCPNCHSILHLKERRENG